MIVCSYLSVYGYRSRLFKCFMSKFYKMTLTFRIEFKKFVEFISNFGTMCYFVICSNIQSFIIILVINYDLVNDPLYVTHLTFDLDLFIYPLFILLILTLKMGQNRGNRLVTRLVNKFYFKSFEHFNVLRL